jgi:hypothetical protein
MNPISVSLSTYVLAIIFALLIALVIKGLALAIEKFGLDRGDEALDIAVPTSNSMKEEEAIAVAIAVARAQRK